jgi:hypothetical protein
MRSYYTRSQEEFAMRSHRARWWRTDGDSEDDDRLAETANDLLRGLAYQESFAKGWSAGLTMPVGLQAGLSGNTTMTEKPMAFPELVQRLNDFLRMVSQKREIFIGIDELDKIESDNDVYKFLNDVKGLFGHNDCYYLVSISQNAMSAFERRGMPVRDAFDSAFDAVVEVDYMDLTDAERLLRRRVIGMPVGFLCLCYVLSGGLPRDLIRVARQVVGLARSHKGPSELGELASALIRDDLLRKLQAIRVVTQNLNLDRASGPFVELLDGALGQVRLGSPTVLTAISTALRAATSASVLGPLGDGDGLTSERRSGKLPALRVETVSYLYFSATVLAYFSSELGSEDLTRAEVSLGAEGVRRLARARQAFAVSPRSAWRSVSEFRAAWNLEEHPFPDWLYGGIGVADSRRAVGPATTPAPESVASAAPDLDL